MSTSSTGLLFGFHLVHLKRNREARKELKRLGLNVERCCPESEDTDQKCSNGDKRDIQEEGIEMQKVLLSHK